MAFFLYKIKKVKFSFYQRSNDKNLKKKLKKKNIT